MSGGMEKEGREAQRDEGVMERGRESRKDAESDGRKEAMRQRRVAG